MVTQPSDNNHSHESSTSSSTKIICIQQSIDILHAVLQRLQEHDYVTAQIMVGVARQTLDDAHAELEEHVSVEIRLREVLHPRQHEAI